jgi:hypothetical protein
MEGRRDVGEVQNFVYAYIIGTTKLWTAQSQACTSLKPAVCAKSEWRCRPRPGDFSTLMANMTQERSDYDGQVRNVNDLLQVCQRPHARSTTLNTTDSECCPTVVPLYLM